MCDTLIPSVFSLTNNIDLLVTIVIANPTGLDVNGMKIFFGHDYHSMMVTGTFPLNTYYILMQELHDRKVQ